MIDKQSFSLRDELTKEQRLLDLDFTIDPGFVHFRKIETIFPPNLMKFITKAIDELPALKDWEKDVRVHHIYTRHFLELCKRYNVPSLQLALAQQKGRLICSIEELLPNKNIYTEERTFSRWKKPRNTNIDVEFHYSSSNVKSDTLKSHLYKGSIVAIVAELYSFSDNKAIYEPIIMGAPWLNPGDENPNFDTIWYAYDYYEIFIEDIDEFSKVNSEPIPEDFCIMKDISEKAFKICLAKILKDNIQTDWGGESSDHFTSHLHLNGRRVTGAFLLKGPHNFKPMSLNHLGKNNDQIVRLATEPANVLIIQHCHDILTAVRKTLRAFAVQPLYPRKYCLIDGKDSLRLLKAYNLIDEAIKITEEIK